VGPLFNPIYWFLGLVFLLVAVLVAVDTGITAFAVSFLVTRKRLATGILPVGLPGTIAAVTIPVVFSLVFCGLCGWSLRGPPTPRRRPRREDISGIWVLSLEPQRRLEEEGYCDAKTSTLEFRENGTFVVTDMPDYEFDLGAWICGSGSGTWDIGRDINGDWAIEADFETWSGGMTGFRTYLDLSGRESPYYVVIWTNYDAGQALWYEKQ
jgi:hypothetical protein